jgi:hypothetical protein
MSKVDKRPHGGRRIGAGRPKNAKNKSTLAIELAANNAIDQTLARLTQEEIKRLLPLEIMILAMHLQLQTVNLMAAVSIAEKASPYLHAKLSANIPPPVLPDDGAVASAAAAALAIRRAHGIRRRGTDRTRRYLFSGDTGGAGDGGDAAGEGIFSSRSGSV